jgi:hypothetical protein
MLNSKVSRSWLIGICVTTLLVGMATAQSLPLYSQNVGNTGFIYTVGVGVFGDQACTVNVTQVNWGTLYPNGSVVKTAFIRNSGSSGVILSMATNTYVPASMQNYLSLSWNATNYVLAPGEVAAAVFVLNVASNVQGGTFGFNIIITGQGT